MVTMDILEILTAKGIEYAPKGGSEYAITCPNASNHQGSIDSLPSFNINIDKMVGNCFACGYALNEAGLAKFLLGEELSDFDIKCLSLQSSIKRIGESTESFNLPLPVDSNIVPQGLPVTEPYRGISVETYNKLQARIVERGWYSGRLCFPVVIHNRLSGVDARALSDDIEPKYLRNKNSTCSHDWLYPYDLVKEEFKGSKYVILGEGIFHGINGYDKGFPTLAYFGANNFSAHKAIMLMALGVEEVILFPDKDKAGGNVVYGNPSSKNPILRDGLGKFLKPWFKVSVAFSDHLKVDAKASLKKGKIVYQDLGDLTKEQIEFALKNRSEFK